MSRFSLLYGSRGEPAADSPRMRQRLYAAFLKVREDALASSIHQKLGIAFFFDGYGLPDVLWENFFTKAALRDILDAVSLHYNLLVNSSRRSDAKWWRDQARRIFAEENLYYRVDENGVVHFSVDEEFERSRQASISALQRPRYANALAAFERAYRELDKTPPDGKEAIRATFGALEGLFKLMFNKANKLGTDEIRNYLKPYVDRRYEDQTPALRAAQKLVGVRSEWVAGAHFYRHEQGQEDVVQPPLELAIATVGAGAAFLRWLAELDQGPSDTCRSAQ